VTIWGQILLKRGGNDVDIKAKDPIQVPTGPVTRARARRFKEELSNLAWRILQQEESMITTDGEQKLVLLIQADST